MKAIITRASDYYEKHEPCDGCKMELIHYSKDTFVNEKLEEFREANVWTKSFHELNELLAWIHSIGGKLVIEETCDYIEYSYKFTIYDSWIE